MLLIHLLSFDSLAKLLGEWLTAVNLVLLDTAYCSDFREVFLASKMVDNIVIDLGYSVRAQKSNIFLDWVYLRKLKINRLILFEKHFDGDGLFIFKEFDTKSVTSINIDTLCVVPRNELVRLINSCPKLNSLRFGGVKNHMFNTILPLIDPQIVQNIPSFSLQRVEKEEFISLTPQNMDYIANQCINLKQVYFGNFDSKSALSLFRNNQKLVFISWQDCKENQMEILNTILTNCPLLQFLQFRISNSGDCLSALCNRMKHSNTIQFVQLVGNSGRDIWFEYVAETFRHVDVSFLTNPQDLTSLVDNAQRHRYNSFMRINACHASVEMLNNYFNGAVNLHKLKLKLVPNLSDNVLCTIATRNAETLHTIDLTLVASTTITGSGLQYLISTCINLTTVILYDDSQEKCYNLADAFIHTTHKLTNLDLNGFNEVNTVFVLQILDKFTQIKKLNLKYCNFIERDVILNYLENSGKSHIKFDLLLRSDG